MWDLYRTIPKAKSPTDEKTPQWVQWRTVVSYGLHHASPAMVGRAAMGLLELAREIETKLGAARSRQYLQWMERPAPQGEASVCRWLGERPPFVAAPVSDGSALSSTTMPAQLGRALSLAFGKHAKILCTIMTWSGPLALDGPIPMHQSTLMPSGDSPWRSGDPRPMAPTPSILGNLHFSPIAFCGS